MPDRSQIASDPAAETPAVLPGANRDDPVLRSARREALVIAVIWLAAMSYTVGYCAWHGYGRAAEELRFVWGFPDWVFGGIIVPWFTCFAISIVFSYFFMRDEPLDEDLQDPRSPDAFDA